VDCAWVTALASIDTALNTTQLIQSILLVSESTWLFTMMVPVEVEGICWLR